MLLYMLYCIPKVFPMIIIGPAPFLSFRSSQIVDSAQQWGPSRGQENQTTLRGPGAPHPHHHLVSQRQENERGRRPHNCKKREIELKNDCMYEKDQKK